MRKMFFKNTNTILFLVFSAGFPEIQTQNDPV